ncbi:IS1182 family transposase [Paraliobacillus zengyii]|uniref:IS1182 family transposase n=3 Tax=Paraliobacillus zengyii TaxID=2213194 RepID=UPI000E3BCEBC|nr:IS1182 family transposase [Paraliobacillus zengyii]
MLRLDPKQLSLHSILYSKIPENHILKIISTVVDFSFINKLLENSYCKQFGRPAKEPELMCKLLFLQHLYNLSDEKVIEEAGLNLAYMYFIGINPEDDLPDKSLLSKFRTQRLVEGSLDEMITEIVRQCVDKGIIEGKSVSIDATHMEANTIKKTPERLMKHLGKKIIQTYEEETEKPLENVPSAPNYKEIEDHNEAKTVMKTYLETVIDQAEEKTSEKESKTSEIIQKTKDILTDPKFMHQKGVRSLIDEDARVGRKSKTQGFYGYKTEFVMTTDERIITSVRTVNGAYMDGSYAKEMLEETKRSGVKVEEVYGDKAYFRKAILNVIEETMAKAYIPVSHSVYRIDESEYTYNKDSDEWYCSQGNTTVDKKRYISNRKDGKREGYKYYFELNQCKTCPLHDLCTQKRARRILTIGLNTTDYYEMSQYKKTEEFKEKYKKRASIEGENAELKRFHGLSRARGYGLLSVSIQSKLAAIAVNMKRISAIVSSSYSSVLIKKYIFRVSWSFR